VIGLAATFWLGGLRGLFLGAVTNVDIGPANQAPKEAARILQFSLAALAVVSEFVATSSIAGASNGIHQRLPRLVNVMVVIAN
jgi:putative copper export protein